MTREEALNLIEQNIEQENLVKHCLAVEAAMRELALHFDQDPEKWGLCGLLHDIDYQDTKNTPEDHSKIGSEILKEFGVDQEICQAVLTHNDIHGLEPQSKMAKALYCVDPLTGLIVAATLVLPSKKIKDLKVENVLNRFQEPKFAQSVKREVIAKCEPYLNLSLKQFTAIVLRAMQGISAELGL